jgi:hypothetical protein
MACWTERNPLDSIIEIVLGRKKTAVPKRSMPEDQTISIAQAGAYEQPSVIT